MKASNKILHEKQYAERILEITGDTMFFVYKDGTCLDFKPNRPDFYIIYQRGRSGRQKYFFIFPFGDSSENAQGI